MKVVHGSKIVIDDILLYSTNVFTLIRYFSCVARVVVRHRLSFKLSKCKFFEPRVKYLGYDLTSRGNCPEKSKFNMITDWKLPVNGNPLLSFIGMCSLYACFPPWFGISIKPLRFLQRLHHRKDIPEASWTPELQTIFDKCKKGITSSPVLVRYDSDKPVFLKTDWSAEGMGYILMQPDDSVPSKDATIKILERGVCDFNLTLKSSCIRPVCFNSRSNRDYEEHYNSFVGETTCGCWTIAHLK